jgi:hypothetical protein
LRHRKGKKRRALPGGHNAIRMPISPIHGSVKFIVHSNMPCEYIQQI